MINKLIIIIGTMLLLFTPLVAAASVFSNVGFDIVLLLIVAFVLFEIIRRAILKK